jgi:hypothetical protein
MKRGPVSKATSADQLFRSVFVQSTILVLGIAVIGSALGALFAGVQGVVSALIGSVVALVFTLLTVISVWFGSKLPLAGFYGLVLGGWLLKIVLFGVLLAVLLGADYLHGPTFFFAVVATVLGGLAIDSIAVLKNRIPTVDDKGSTNATE